METITLTTHDGPAQAWVARPDGTSEHPGVLFFMDAFGLRPQIASMAQRIADWGYVVIAPNLFYRDGTIEQLALPEDLSAPGVADQLFQSTLGPRVRALTPDRILADAPAYLAALDTLAPGPVAITGYCMGARNALRVACAFPDRVAAVGGWHGDGLATDAPDSPHLGLGHARAAFAFGHATNDRGMDEAAIERLGEALTNAGLRHTNEVFPGPHGYAMADTPMYAEQADALHWQGLENLLRTSLAGS